MRDLYPVRDQSDGFYTHSGIQIWEHLEINLKVYFTNRIGKIWNEKIIIWETFIQKSTPTQIHFGGEYEYDTLRATLSKSEKYTH